MRRKRFKRSFKRRGYSAKRGSSRRKGNRMHRYGSSRGGIRL